MQRIYLGHLRDPVCRALTLGASGFLVATSAALAAGAYEPYAHPAPSSVMHVDRPDDAR